MFNRKYPQKICDPMTAKLKILSEWTIENGLGVNPSKTELVLFTNRYKIPQLNGPILNDCNLSFTAGANKYTYALRRTAAQTLRSHTRSNIATPSPEWLKKMEWAKKVLPNYGQDKPTQDGATGSDPLIYPHHRQRPSITRPHRQGQSGGQDFQE